MVLSACTQHHACYHRRCAADSFFSHLGGDTVLGAMGLRSSAVLENCELFINIVDNALIWAVSGSAGEGALLSMKQVLLCSPGLSSYPERRAPLQQP
jgi:hypothetical protein